MTRAGRIAFALLVVATLGAFVVTQKLKSGPPLVVRPHINSVFSPTPDARVQKAKVSFWIVNGDDVSVSIVDREGRIVRTLLDGYHLPKRTRITRWWDGRMTNGAVAPDGSYRVRIALIHQGRTIDLAQEIEVDTRPPHPVVTKVEPRSGSGPAFLPQRGVEAVTVKVRGTEGRRARLEIFRTDVAPPRRVGQATIAAGETTATWDGTLGGEPAPAGTYLMGLLVADRSGNVGTFPAARPPQDAHAWVVRTPAGVTVRYLAAAPPLAPVEAGKIAVVLVDARGKPYEWALRRLGDDKVLARGRGDEARLRVRVPRGQSGLHVLTLVSGEHRTAVPIAVRTAKGRAVLVVLPALTWQGRNEVDDDGNGIPNTLNGGPRARAGLLRPFAEGLPAGLDAHEGALLRFLDANLLRYDLTTDAAVAAGEGPPLAGHKGVVLAGDSRWITPKLRASLRTYLSGGGRVWSLGTDSLRRTVRLDGGTLAHPSAARSTDALGARPRQPLVEPISPATITVDEQDLDLDLFHGTGGQFTGYDAYEMLAPFGAGTKLLSSAGAEPGVPVIAAWQVGDGVAIHTGLPQLVGFAEDGDLEAAALVRRLWAVLGRG